MYDVRNLNIWKENSHNPFGSKGKVLCFDVSGKKEAKMSDKCKQVYEEIVKLVPTANLAEVKNRRGGKLRFPIYINEKLKTTEIEALDLSVRSNNCLHRAGFKTIGELVESIEGAEDLRKIRNCGSKSVDEIMEQLFCYQYVQLEGEKKEKYIRRILELNKE